MDFSNFNAAEQAHMTKIIEKKQVRGHITILIRLTHHSVQMQDFLKLYSGLVERCFNSCVNDFTSKSLGTKEVSSSDILLCLTKSISGYVHTKLCGKIYEAF